MAILFDNAANIVRAVEIMGLLHIGFVHHLFSWGFFYTVGYIQFKRPCSKKKLTYCNLNSFNRWLFLF